MGDANNVIQLIFSEGTPWKKEREAFRTLKMDGKLHHGSGRFNYEDWGVWIESDSGEVMF